MAEYTPEQWFGWAEGNALSADESVTVPVPWQDKALIATMQATMAIAADVIERRKPAEATAAERADEFVRRLQSVPVGTWGEERNKFVSTLTTLNVEDTRKRAAQRVADALNELEAVHGQDIYLSADDVRDGNTGTALVAFDGVAYAVA